MLGMSMLMGLSTGIALASSGATIVDSSKCSGAGLLVYDTDSKRFLLGRRRDGKGWDSFGGEVDKKRVPGCDPIKVAELEVLEETGTWFNSNDTSDWEKVDGQSWVVAVKESDLGLPDGPGRDKELLEFRWFSLDQVESGCGLYAEFNSRWKESTRPYLVSKGLLAVEEPSPASSCGSGVLVTDEKGRSVLLKWRRDGTGWSDFIGTPGVEEAVLGLKEHGWLWRSVKPREAWTSAGSHQIAGSTGLKVPKREIKGAAIPPYAWFPIEGLDQMRGLAADFAMRWSTDYRPVLDRASAGLDAARVKSAGSSPVDTSVDSGAGGPRDRLRPSLLRAYQSSAADGSAAAYWHAYCGTTTSSPFNPRRKLGFDELGFSHRRAFVVCVDGTGGEVHVTPSPFNRWARALTFQRIETVVRTDGTPVRVDIPGETAIVGAKVLNSKGKIEDESTPVVEAAEESVDRAEQKEEEKLIALGTVDRELDSAIQESPPASDAAKAVLKKNISANARIEQLARLADDADDNLSRLLELLEKRSKAEAELNTAKVATKRAERELAEARAAAEPRVRIVHGPTYAEGEITLTASLGLAPGKRLVDAARDAPAAGTTPETVADLMEAAVGVAARVDVDPAWTKEVLASLEKGKLDDDAIRAAVRRLQSPRLAPTGRSKLQIEDVYNLSLFIGVGAAFGDAVTGSWDVSDLGAAPQIVSKGVSYTDIELILGATYYPGRRPRTAVSLAPGISVAAGLFSFDDLKLEPLSSVYIGPTVGWSRLSISIGPVVKRGAHLRDGYEVGTIVPAGTKEEDFTEKRWGLGYGLFVNVPFQLFNGPAKGK